jgi:hypothetical protein
MYNTHFTAILQQRAEELVKGRTKACATGAICKDAGQERHKQEISFGTTTE